MAADDRVAFNTVVPRWLHERAKKTAKFHGLTLLRVVQEGLLARVVHYEEEQAKILASKKPKDDGLRKPRTITPLDQRVPGLQPLGGNPDDDVKPPPTLDSPSEFADFYADRGAYIAQAEGSYDRRARIAESLASMKKQFPLTHPKDSEILKGLEDAAKAAAPAPDIVEQILDPGTIKTVGDI